MEMKTILIFVCFFCCLTVFGFSCPDCGVPMRDGCRFCTNCGREKYEQVVDAPSPDSKPVQQTSSYRRYDTYNRYGHDDNSSSPVVDRLAGTGRGLVTTTLSPFNVFRGMATGFHWLFSDSGHSERQQGGISVGDLGPLGAAICAGAISGCAAIGVTLGAITTGADVINGTFDMLSVGYYGDWLYDSKGVGNPTPWIWEREWYTGKMPWINRK